MATWSILRLAYVLTEVRLGEGTREGATQLPAFEQQYVACVRYSYKLFL